MRRNAVTVCRVRFAKLSSGFGIPARLQGQLGANQVDAFSLNQFLQSIHQRIVRSYTYCTLLRQMGRSFLRITQTTIGHGQGIMHSIGAGRQGQRLFKIIDRFRIIALRQRDLSQPVECCCTVLVDFQRCSKILFRLFQPVKLQIDAAQIHRHGHVFRAQRASDLVAANGVVGLILLLVQSAQ